MRQCATCMLPLVLALLACTRAQQDALAAPGSTIDRQSLTLQDQATLAAESLTSNQTAVDSSSGNSTDVSYNQAQTAQQALDPSTQPTSATNTRDDSTSSDADAPPVSNSTQSASQSASNSTSSHSGSSCIEDSSQNDCADYTYGSEAASNDLDAICKSKAFLSGCSVFRQCQQGVDPASIGKAPATCDKLELLATICGLDSLAADEQGCSSYRSLCLSPDTVVQQCNTSQNLQHLLPTAAARQLSRVICEGPGSPDTCKRCDWSSDTPACDFFSIYGALCVSSPDLNECSIWHKMCDTDPSLYVCRQQLPGGRPGPAGAARYKGPAAQAPSPVWAPSSAAISSCSGWLPTAIAIAAMTLATL